MNDVPIKELCRRTGKSVDQLLKMRRAGKGRWTRNGKYWCLHPEDAAKLEAVTYQGSPL